MRRKLLTFLAAMALTTGLSAQTFTYLMVNDNAGTATALPVSGLKITFAGGNLVAATSTGTKTFALNSLASMSFSTNGVVGISSTTTATPSVTLSGRSLSVSAAAGTPIAVYGVSGQCVASTVAIATTTQFSISAPAGIYLVKVGAQTSKIQVK